MWGFEFLWPLGFVGFCVEPPCRSQRRSSRCSRQHTLVGWGPGSLAQNATRIDGGSKFLSSPFIIRVPFFLLFCFNKETPKWKGQKGTIQEPGVYGFRVEGRAARSSWIDIRIPRTACHIFDLTPSPIWRVGDLDSKQLFSGLDVCRAFGGHL